MDPIFVIFKMTRYGQMEEAKSNDYDYSMKISLKH